jgi:transposase-like protein
MKNPPFCPNRDCPNHQNHEQSSTWFIRSGTFKSNISNSIQRYKCKSCGMRFSSQSFSLDFAVKKKLPYPYILNQLKSAAGIRDIARDLRVAPDTVINRISRLARQATAIHSKLKSSIKLKEDLVADGFESFVVSQYFPNNIHLLAGKDSQYLYAFDYAHMNRKGRMTEKQKKMSRILKNSTPGSISITSSFSNICRQLDRILEKGSMETVSLYTDEKTEYRNVLKEYRFYKRVAHRTVNSKAERNLRNDLFSVNYMDREIRKDNANHVRETVQFSRNVNNELERMAVYGFYHNYMKPYRINGKENRLHAEVAGLDRTAVRSQLKTFYTRRRFYSKLTDITSTDMKLWLRAFATPGKTGSEYLPAYAWA